MEFVFEDNEQTPQRRPYSASTNDFSSDFSSDFSNGVNQNASWTASSANPAPSKNSGSLAKRRNVPSTVSEVEIAPNPKRKRKTAKVNYLSSAKAPKKKKASSSRNFTWTWNKVGWLICLSVFLRLIFMDRGVAHYYQMQDTLQEKKQELERVIEENRELVSEIHKIKVSPSYQRKLAREHLGVIAKDEYLILFAADGGPRSI